MRNRITSFVPLVPRSLRQTLSASKRSAPVSMRNNEPQSLKRSASQHYTRNISKLSSLLKSAQVCSSFSTGTMENLVLGCFWVFGRSLLLTPFKVINQPLSLHQQNPYLPALASHRLTRCQVSTFGFSQQKLQKFHGTTFKEPLRLQSFQPRSPSPL